MALDFEQPAGTPIYFGVDFNPTLDSCPDGTFSSSNEISRVVTAYFETIHDKLAETGHKVGVYGSGAICGHLDAKPPRNGRKLVEYFWLSASILHQGQGRFFNSGNWNLYQNKTEIPQIAYMGTGPIKGNIDTDVSNPDKPDFGQWRRKSASSTPSAQISKEDEERILEGRAFYPDPTKVYWKRDKQTGKLSDNHSKSITTQGRTCRIIECYPPQGGVGKVAAVNFSEGETTDAYFYVKDIKLGLCKGNMIEV